MVLLLWLLVAVDVALVLVVVVVVDVVVFVALPGKSWLQPFFFKTVPKPIYPL